MNKIRLVLCTFAMLFSAALDAQIVVTNTQTPEELVNEVLVGAGVIVSNVKFNGSVPLAEAIQVQAGYFDATGTTFPMAEGIILATGNVNVAVGPNDSGGASDNVGVAPPPIPSDPDLDAISTSPIFNPAILEFDFIPSGDSVIFNYIFASEEYLEYVDAGVNDVFGFFISGPGFAGPFTGGAENIATIPGTAIPVSIDNLNDEDYPEYYVNNDGGADVQYDGHTTVLSARAEVICGETYHIKMAIGDAGDPVWDSGVFLEASSFSSNGISVEIASVLGEDAIQEGCDSAVVCFIRPEDSDTIDLTVDFEISGTAINGTDYPLMDETVFFPEGEDTVKIWIIPIDDGTIEGPETITITVEIINECGDTITTEATIEIVDPQDFDLITTDINIECPEDSVMLTFETDGGIPEFDIEWSSGGTEMDEWVPGDIVGTTTYTVTVTDVCGTESTATIDVIFDPTDVVSITFNEDLFIICPGEEIDIDATIVDPYDPGEVTYEWDPTGETTEDITTTPADEGWYYLTVFDGCNTVTDSTKIEFGEVEITDIIVVDAIDCPGIADPVLGSIVVEPDDPTWTYELVGYVPEQDNGNFPDLAGGINYILVVTDENGCTTDTIVPVGLGENAVVATWAPDSLRDVSCFGANDGGAYVFDISGGLMPPYDVTWTNVDGVFDVETGVPVDGDSERDDLPGGTWVVTITDEDGCAWSHSFEIFEPDELTMTLIWNEPSCFGYSDGSVTVNTSGGNGGEVYTITDADGNIKNIGNSNTANVLPTGTYYITVVDENGCTVSGEVFIDQPGELDADLNISQPLCYGIATGLVEVDTVYNYSGSYDAISYYWNPNPSGIEGLGATVSNHLAEGSYTLTINDANGCSQVFDFEIVYPDEIIVSIDTRSALCRTFGYQNGNGVVYGTANGGSGALTYLWTDLTTGNTTTNTTWGGQNPGNYEFTVTDANGCIKKETVYLDSLNPKAIFTINSDQLNSDYQGTAPVEVEFINQSIHFSDSLDPLSDTTFFWNLDYPNADWQITHSYFQTYDTTYEARGESYTVDVCLIAFNKNDCKDTACQKITIYEPITLVNVNIFSPDGDGLNDMFTFDFYAKSISEFNCVIVNRWGIKVGEINAIEDGWDGTDLNGDPCTDGVYFYTYTAKSDNSTKLEGQGTVSIARNK